MNIIITGATGMVGEGVLLVCLEHPKVKEVLIINRKESGLRHPKLKELIVKDFAKLDDAELYQFANYDACFFCAGVSSIGHTEASFTKVTYGMVVPFAKSMSTANSNMVFTYVSGSGTDSTEKGRVMWARIKGKTENALLTLPFKKVYNFRPAVIKPMSGQKNLMFMFKVVDALYPLMALLLPKWTCKMQDIGLAMIHCVSKGYTQSTLEVSDIKKCAKS